MKEELTRTIDIITPLANMNCVEIHSQINDSFINGNSQLFQQCLLNIAKNCIEAMPISGRLTFLAFEEEKKVMIQIFDNGEGMSAEQLSRIGEPYFTTKGREGTGLGMMTVIKIVDMMHGHIKVESVKERGTTFFLTFPKINIEKKGI